MALIFSRLAHNFVKAGYYPTDSVTLERIIGMLSLPSNGHVRMLDPCCGEGSALADIRQELTNEAAPGTTTTTETFGVELDSDRAWQAKKLLDRALHTDVHDAVVKARSMGLLFLNPPYGFGVADKAGQQGLQAGSEKAERLERTFLRKTVPYLAYGGVLVYVVPHYALDDEIRSYLVRNFERLQVFMAPERQFKQCVVIGIRRKPAYPAKGAQQPLIDAQASEEGAQMLPQIWTDIPYVIPAAQGDQEVDFHAVRIDELQLRDELDKYRHATLWHGLHGHFCQTSGACRPPLRDLTQWHQALALAAGQVTGKITSTGGRIFLIKGDTFKRKERQVTVEFDDKGNASQTTVMLDRFVPVINAIELTPDHRRGQIVKIA